MPFYPFFGEGSPKKGYPYNLTSLVEDLVVHSTVLRLCDSARLMVIDSTFGVGVPLLWRLQDRLKQVLVINCSWIFRPGKKVKGPEVILGCSTRMCFC